MKIVIIVQHLIGSGHYQRMFALARALQQGGHQLVLLTGGEMAENSVPDDLTVVQVPPIRANDLSFRNLVNASGDEVGPAYWDKRLACMINVMEESRPDVLIIESFPFARWKFRNELTVVVDKVRQINKNVTVVCSIRDVLQPKSKQGRNDEIVALLHKHFDRVWVHGDPSFIPLEASFYDADKIAGLIDYTGYLRTTVGPVNIGAVKSGEILVSAGGGAAGETLFRIALNAATSAAGQQYLWRMRIGANLPESIFQSILQIAPSNMIVERAMKDFPLRLRGCLLSISQAGYNTFLDVLEAGCKCVLVPFSRCGEMEQVIRARRIVGLGLAELVDESALCPETLMAAIDRVTKLQRGVANSRINMEGARKCRALVREFSENVQPIRLDGTIYRGV